MGKGSGSVRRHALFGALIASIVLALMVPAVAFAANTATFSSISPKAGSTSTVQRPTITIGVYDRYGVKGSTSYSMFLDGHKVKPTMSYATRGDYRRLTLMYRVPSDLPSGLHGVIVNIQDMKRRRSAYSWTFTITDPEPPAPLDMPVTIASASCGSCHSGFPALHPMTNCVACHGSAAPPRANGTPMGSVSATDPNSQAHSLGCSLEVPCHGGEGNAFPHVLGTDCGRCHNPSYPTIPQAHGAATAADHTSTSAFCTSSGCHSSSLTSGHYKYSINGAKLSCATCHSSRDPKVVAAIASKDTACESCHGLPDHPAQHSVTRTDTCATCHAGTSLTAIHTGTCASCHSSKDAAVIAAIAAHAKNCSACHDFVDHTALHDVARTDGCASCHAGTNLTRIHTGTCASCHDSTKTEVVAAIAAHDKACAACHATVDHVTLHEVTRADTCAGAQCHTSTNLTTIHTTCATCHDSTRTAVKAAITAGAKACSSCHDFADHGALHDVVRTDGCILCHTGTDLTTITVRGLPAAKHATCATCHKSTAPAVVIAIAAGNTACAACHLASELHPTAVAKHSAPAGGCGFSGSTGCHTGGTNVAAIHSAVKDRTDSGCGICHGATALTSTPTAVCATAACHPDPHPEAAKLHAASGPCLNSSCHNDSNVTLVHNGDCGACHGSTDPKVVAAVAVGDTTCSNCHSAFHAEQGTKHLVDGASISSIHGDVCTRCHFQSYKPSLVCADCHSGDKLPAIHVVDRTTDDCVSCHVGTALTEVHTKATCISCHGSTDSKVVAAIATGGAVCSDCHAAHDIVGIHSVDRSLDSCAGADCHAASNVNLTTIHTGCPKCHGADASKKVKDAVAAKDRNCATCHDPHDIPVIHAVAQNPACIDCHVGTQLTSITHSNGTVSAVHATCATCHGANARALAKTVVAAGKPAVCTDCHPIGHDIPVIHAVTRSDACVTCHAGTQLTSIKRSNGVVSTVHGTCATCHGANARALAKTVVAAGGHAVCGDCHADAHVADHAYCNGCHSGLDSYTYGSHSANQMPDQACSNCHGTTFTPLVGKTWVQSNFHCGASCHGYGDSGF